MSVIPFILAGQFEEVGKAFSEAVKPDFEVVYFATSPQSAVTDIPLVLKGEIPTPSSKVGSGNLVHGTPKAVVIGAQVYDDTWIEAVRQELHAAGKQVPFLKPDVTGAQGGGVGAGSQGDRAKATAERVTTALKKLEGEGKLDGNDDGVYVY
ncbi:uncharacterized protein GGS22DRAFT_1015 [Annulohypoxylon maeteangense]|uniref:uncharacterized protein n=1 Tax=Annulohypoxylon maeteangense TaxID=1927788 RepID=UPI002008A37E|nr:uncharacterized protein GGS22DRAFT_1015 [Annulohypoxylon maeteangense]KAI0889541.1 hypothetical protein GGS22DRAFT_1015 [Annulohypoxylon maeteangense]